MAKIFVEMTEEEYEQYKKMKKDLSDIKNNTKSISNNVSLKLSLEDISKYIKKYGERQEIYSDPIYNKIYEVYKYEGFCKKPSVHFCSLILKEELVDSQ